MQLVFVMLEPMHVCCLCSNLPKSLLHALALSLSIFAFPSKLLCYKILQKYSKYLSSISSRKSMTLIICLVGIFSNFTACNNTRLRNPRVELAGLQTIDFSSFIIIPASRLLNNVPVQRVASSVFHPFVSI